MRCIHFLKGGKTDRETHREKDRGDGELLRGSEMAVRMIDIMANTYHHHLHHHLRLRRDESYYSGKLAVKMSAQLATLQYHL